MWTSCSLVLQASFLSKKGSQRSKYRGHSKTLCRSMSLSLSVLLRLSPLGFRAKSFGQLLPSRVWWVLGLTQSHLLVLFKAQLGEPFLGLLVVFFHHFLFSVFLFFPLFFPSCCSENWHLREQHWQALRQPSRVLKKERKDQKDQSRHVRPKPALNGGSRWAVP